MTDQTKSLAGFKVGDCVRLLRLDGTFAAESVVIHDLWGDEMSSRNASFMYGNMEQFTHTDLIRHAKDNSLTPVPDGGIWFIARGDNMGWGRAQSLMGAVRNMKRQGGKVTEYVVHQVSKWTQVDGMGNLTYPEGIEPIEVHRVEKKTA